jgi:hypothetical protein
MDHPTVNVGFWARAGIARRTQKKRTARRRVVANGSIVV